MQTTITTDPVQTVLRGDVDCSGNVDIVDVLMLNRHLLAGEPISQQAAKNADVDNDGVPTNADTLLILQYTIGLVSFQ